MRSILIAGLNLSAKRRKRQCTERGNFLITGANFRPSEVSEGEFLPVSSERLLTTVSVGRCHSGNPQTSLGYVRDLEYAPFGVLHHAYAVGWLEFNVPFSAQIRLYQRRKVRGGELSSYPVKEG